MSSRMLTEDTADLLGVSNRLDAAQSISAGAQYIRDLREALPASIAEPDRLWLALAAYNLGMGHLNDARYIAKTQNVLFQGKRDEFLTKVHSLATKTSGTELTCYASLP